MPPPYSLWPAFKRGDSVECEHGLQYIIKVKVTIDPLSSTDLHVVESVLHMMHISSAENNKENPCKQKLNHIRTFFVMSKSLKNYSNTPLKRNLNS